MLIKLMKQEFRATARMMIPMYLVMLALAVGARFFFDDLGDLGDLLTALCALAVVACILVNVAAMILRFKQNLLGDEGYLMLTLPVTVHQHLWAKLVAAVVWFAGTLAMSLLSLCILVDRTDFTMGAAGIQVGVPLVSIHGVAVPFPDNGLFLLELAVLGFVAGCTLCLQFYAALAAGHSFSSHKMALSVVCFVLLSMATTVLTEVMPIPEVEFHHNWVTTFHLALWVISGCTAVVGAIYYGITVYFLEHRLNLS